MSLQCVCVCVSAMSCLVINNTLNDSCYFCLCANFVNLLLLLISLAVDSDWFKLNAQEDNCCSALDPGADYSYFDFNSGQGSLIFFSAPGAAYRYFRYAHVISIFVDQFKADNLFY